MPQLFYLPGYQALSSSGAPLGGAKLYFFESGTSTPQDVWSDAARTNPPLSNPVIADAQGRFPQIYPDPGVLYRARLTDSSGTQQWQEDGLSLQAFLATTSEIAASVTPVNYAYPPLDPKRQGATGDGTTDDRDAFFRQDSVGGQIHVSRGIYRIASDLTLTSSLRFDEGAILKPDAGVTITINASIQSGPWRIFNVSASGSAISGAAQVTQVYAEWFGAVGDDVTDDHDAIQAALNFAAACGYVALQLLAKTYYTSTTLYAGGSASEQGWGCVSIYGASGASGPGTQPTTLTDHGHGGHEVPILRYRNFSSNNTHGEVVGIFFTGAGADTIGIEFNGTCEFRVRRCRFGTIVEATSGNFVPTLLEGIRYNNTDPGTYTEFCIAEGCEFWSAIAVDYVGGGSYHGSGLDGRCMVSLVAGGALAIIHAGAQPYNAPLDVAVWTLGTATLIISNNTTFSCSFVGRLSIEVQGGTTTLGGGQVISFAGTLSAHSAGILAGTFVHADTLIQNAGTNTYAVGGKGNFRQELTTGANTLASHPSLYGQTRLTYARILRFAPPAYDFRYLLLVSPFGGTVVTLGNPQALDTPGYGAPTFGINGSTGQLTVTNAVYPASGVTVLYRDIGIDSFNVAI